MTDDLIAFLDARLDEDETAAYAADLNPDSATPVAGYDPARVLRETSAKRRILAEHPSVLGPGWCSTCDVPADVKGSIHGCTTLRLLAATYSTHPNYREEWKP